MEATTGAEAVQQRFLSPALKKSLKQVYWGHGAKGFIPWPNNSETLRSWHLLSTLLLSIHPPIARTPFFSFSMDHSLKPVAKHRLRDIRGRVVGGPVLKLWNYLIWNCELFHRIHRREWCLKTSCLVAETELAPVRNLCKLSHDLLIGAFHAQRSVF